MLKFVLFESEDQRGCRTKETKRERSSVGSERLPYKQRVGGSNPSAPTNETKAVNLTAFFVLDGFASKLSPAHNKNPRQQVAAVRFYVSTKRVRNQEGGCAIKGVLFSMVIARVLRTSNPSAPTNETKAVRLTAFFVLVGFASELSPAHTSSRYSQPPYQTSRLGYMAKRVPLKRAPVLLCLKFGDGSDILLKLFDKRFVAGVAAVNPVNHQGPRSAM